MESTPYPGDHPEPSLVRSLQAIHRPTEIKEAHFAALGVHVHADAPAEDLIPDPSYLPPSTGWDGLNLDELRAQDKRFRRPLANGNMSPEARSYVDRRVELSISNQAAFRTVRRMRPEAGKQLVRLGNSYEFYKQMELMAAYWDDTSLSPKPESSEGEHTSAATQPQKPRDTRDGDAGLEQPGHATIATPAESNIRAESNEVAKQDVIEQVTYRTAAGAQMPPEFRHNLVAAFVKLVAYEFGCNVMPPRVEPRLHLLEPAPTSSAAQGTYQKSPRASYFPSGCVFLNRSATTREAARAGIVQGPVAAVSARNTTNFLTPRDSYIDFGRELIAALATAQLRARDGKLERRFGENKWWAVKKRWGGGFGGPLGREVDSHVPPSNKDATANAPASGPSDSAASEQPPPPATAAPAGAPPAQEKGRPIPMRGQPANKRPRRNPHQYDNYRIVRPPASNWDKKTRYEAIGKTRGAGHDDVFVFSSLFHHFCILRFRIPDRLLEVLDGDSDGEVKRKGGAGGPRAWGRLEVWRSRWFDLFLADDRKEAMRVLWGTMAWLMRQNEPGQEAPAGKGPPDVAMKDS
jgi:hypothetical protein